MKRLDEIVDDLKAIRDRVEENEFESALELIAMVEAEGIQNPSLKVTKARCIQLAEKTSYSLADAELALREAMQLDPEYVPAKVELAWFYYNVLDDEPEAGLLFRAAFDTERLHLLEIVEGLEKVAEEAELRLCGSLRHLLEPPK